MQARRILLIGAAGLVGRHLRDAFAGFDVVATHHRTAEAGTTPLDITDQGATRALIRKIAPDAIVLAAAEPYVERCEREPEATRRINVDAARTIAEEAARIAAALVVFSSDYVFDGTRGAYSEDDAVAPLNEYGRQKVELEQIGRAVDRHLVLRTSGVFGPEPAGKNFVLQLERTLREGKAFTVPSDQLITPTYAPSLAGAVVGLIVSDACGTFHVAGPRILTRPEFALMACDAFGLDPSLVTARPTDELGLSAPRPKRAGLSVNKVRGALGRDLTDPSDALREMAVRS